MNRSRAFTLIEIILVVVIIALLATLVLPRVTGRSEQAKRAAAAAQINSLKMALNQFELDCGRYPSTAEGLDALVRRPGDLPESAQWRRYLDEATVPTDPWGYEYVYRYPGTVNDDGFDLLSVGPDGQEGTDDDIGNTIRANR